MVKYWQYIVIFILALLVLILGLRLTQAYNQINDLDNQKLALRREFDSELGRAKTREANQAELEATILQLKANQTIDIKKNGESVRLAAKAVITSSSSSSGQTQIFYKEVPVTSGAIVAPENISFQDYRLKLLVKLPSGDIDYVLNQKFDFTLVQTEQNGKVAATYINVKELDDKGNSVSEFNVESFEVLVKKLQEDNHIFLDPTLSFGISAGLTYPLLQPFVSPNLNFSYLYYGTKEKPLWRFIDIGLFYPNAIGAYIVPASYNIGDPLPLIDRLWLGILVGGNIQSNGTVGLMVSADL